MILNIQNQHSEPTMFNSSSLQLKLFECVISYQMYFILKILIIFFWSYFYVVPGLYQLRSKSFFFLNSKIIIIHHLRANYFFCGQAQFFISAFKKNCTLSEENILQTKSNTIQSDRQAWLKKQLMLIYILSPVFALLIFCKKALF